MQGFIVMRVISLIRNCSLGRQGSLAATATVAVATAGDISHDCGSDRKNMAKARQNSRSVLRIIAITITSTSANTISSTIALALAIVIMLRTIVYWQ